MLEKDKNCIEFSMRSMMATHKPYQEDTEITITGMAPGKSLLLANNPFDIPCDVVVVSKRYFERLQTENEKLKKKLAVPDPLPEFRELLEKLYSKEDAENLEWTLNHICGGRDSSNGWISISLFWKRKYKALSRIVGFSSTEEIQDYLTNEADCDTLHEAISKLRDEVTYTCDEWKDMKKKLEECEKDYISARDKVEALDKEIGVYSRALEDWKEGTGCPSPSAAKTLIENGRTHIVYLNDPLGVIAKWEKVTGYDRPADFLKWKTNIEGIMKAWKDRTGCRYPGEAGELLEKWKTLTKCETPEAAATWITSYESACERGNKLASDIENWQNVTGYSTPEEYTASKILTIASAYDVEKEWKEATGCETPKVAYVAMDGFKELIKKKDKEIEELRADYSHLLLTTGFESEGEIEDALDRCDHSTLRKALVDYEFDYEALLKLTGYKSERDIRVALNHSEQFVYESMRELINSLKRQAKFTNLNWQNSTGFITPEKCGEYIKKLEDKLSRINTISEEG